MLLRPVPFRGIATSTAPQLGQHGASKPVHDLVHAHAHTQHARNEKHPNDSLLPILFLGHELGEIQ